MATTALSQEQRKSFHGWKYKVVSWKWQHMSTMFRRFSPIAPVFLQKLDVEDIKKPASEGDGRVTAMDPVALRNIQEAMNSPARFLAVTEVLRVFSDAVDKQHGFLVSCPCHDWIWSDSSMSDLMKSRRFSRKPVA